MAVAVTLDNRLQFFKKKKINKSEGVKKGGSTIAMLKDTFNRKYFKPEHFSSK